jgi:hypothetical protein
MNIQKFINRINELHTTQSGNEFIDVLEEYNEQLCECDEDDFLNEIENISDIGLKYLLHAIIEESQFNLICIELYELSSKNDCIIALYKLARLYDDGMIITVDVNKSLYYYYQYYNKINDLETFIETINVMRDINQCKIFMNTYCAVMDENKELYEQNKIQKEINDKLREYITELEYMPNGVGYNECKAHFKTLAKEKL